MGGGGALIKGAKNYDLLVFVVHSTKYHIYVMRIHILMMPYAIPALLYPRTMWLLCDNPRM